MKNNHLSSYVKQKLRRLKILKNVWNGISDKHVAIFGFFIAVVALGGQYLTWNGWIGKISGYETAKLGLMGYQHTGVTTLDAKAPAAKALIKLVAEHTGLPNPEKIVSMAFLDGACFVGVPSNGPPEFILNNTFNPGAGFWVYYPSSAKSAQKYYAFCEAKYSDLEGWITEGRKRLEDFVNGIVVSVLTLFNAFILLIVSGKHRNK